MYIYIQVVPVFVHVCVHGRDPPDDVLVLDQEHQADPTLESSRYYHYEVVEAFIVIATDPAEAVEVSVGVH